jgi:hypothetical protein
MIASPVAIVVDADLAELRKTEQALEHVGFVVMGAGSFAQAKSLLVSITPEIVIADIKLRPSAGSTSRLCARYGGRRRLHRHAQRLDTVLEADAKRLSASSVVKTRIAELYAPPWNCSARQHGHEAVRRSHRKLAPTSTVVQIAASNAEVVDVSYEGLRLKLQTAAARPADGRVPESFDIVFPDQDFSLRAARIWAAHDSQTGGWLCGADVSQSDSHQLQRWREFVDSVV